MMDENPIIIKRVHSDYLLLVATALLVMCGIIMVYSSSAVLAQERYGDSYYFIKKEIIFAAMGFIALAVAVRIPYIWWKRAVYPLLAVSVIALLLAFVPGLKGVAAGATRWIRLGGVSFQPSEFAKFAAIVFLAYALERKASKIKTFTIGFLPQAAAVSILVLIILAQRDFGAAFVIILFAGLMMFVAGVRLKYLLASVVSILPAVYFLVVSVGYRKKRILAFLDPWSDRYGSGFQIIQSLVSFNEGGVFGRGLGEGRQKLFYLPEAHTDFIFSVLGEELGLVGVLVVVCLFGFFVWRAITISLRAPDLFGRYLAFGIALFIGLQALFNVGVVMGLLPTKGLVLPFISYGGSALVTMLVAVGVLLNISSYRVVKEED